MVTRAAVNVFTLPQSDAIMTSTKSSHAHLQAQRLFMFLHVSHTISHFN